MSAPAPRSAGTAGPKPRPVCLIFHRDTVDLFRLKRPRRAISGQFRLHDTRDFRLCGCQFYKDTQIETADDRTV